MDYRGAAAPTKEKSGFGLRWLTNQRLHAAARKLSKANSTTKF